jgi:hypothetical protein
MGVAFAAGPFELRSSRIASSRRIPFVTKRMVCRVKPGNDERVRKREARSRPTQDRCLNRRCAQ